MCAGGKSINICHRDRCGQFTAVLGGRRAEREVLSHTVGPQHRNKSAKTAASDLISLYVISN